MTKDILEIEYSIGAIKTSMFVAAEHSFFLISKEWIKAADLSVGHQILSCNETTAQIEAINEIEDSPQRRDLKRDLKISHNHNYFVTKAPPAFYATLCERAPENPLELVAYELANKPSKLPDGKPTGHHSGPWAAARYINSEAVGELEVIGWGRANDNMCAEDAAVSDLRNKLAGRVALHQGNVEVSHAYLRKYTKKGRFVNTMSPCTHCRNNYGSALNDTSIGTSDLVKEERGFLPPVDK